MRYHSSGHEETMVDLLTIIANHYYAAAVAAGYEVDEIATSGQLIQIKMVKVKKK